MIIKYTPAGGEPEHYDARTLRTSEASIAARTVDMTWPEIKKGLGDEDLDAMRAVVWVLKKRSAPSLRWGDWDPGVDEMVTRLDRREVEDYVANAARLAERDTNISRQDVADALAELPTAAYDSDHAETVIRGLTEDPKALAAEGTEGTQSLTSAINATSI